MIKRMRLYFKQGRGKLHFLWCTSLRIDKVGKLGLNRKLTYKDKSDSKHLKNETKNYKPLNFEKVLTVHYFFIQVLILIDSIKL